MTGSGMLVLVLVSVAQFAGINFDETTASILVRDVLEVLGIVFAIWGQLRRKDLSFGFWRE